MAINLLLFETILNMKHVIPTPASAIGFLHTTRYYHSNLIQYSALAGKSSVSKVVEGQRTGRRTGYVVPG
jgi:hypothetical protein